MVVIYLVVTRYLLILPGYTYLIEQYNTVLRRFIHGPKV